MRFADTVIFSVVEGITEFLPVSSTGHLILTARLLGLAQTEFMKSFEIAIQLGAILAVVVLYWRSLLVDFEVLKRVLTAFLPTAGIGLVFYKVIKQYLLANEQVVLWSLFLGGVFLILFEREYREKGDADGKLAEIAYSKAFLIGVFQAIALIPGVSRAAATIYGGLFLGLKRKTIVEFSFLLAVPTMAAAAGLDLVKSGAVFSGSQAGALAAGFLVSFAVAMASIRFLLAFIQHRGFTLFGIYRIAAALVFWFVF